MLKFIKILFFCSLFFIVLYYEQFSFGGLRITILWKIPLIIFLFLYIFYNYRSKLPFFFHLCVLLAIKNLIVTHPFININLLLSETLKFIVFPTLTMFFLSKYSNQPYILKRIGIILAVFFILATAPFVMNVIEVPSVIEHDQKSLTVYGGEGYFLTAIYGSPHNLSITLAISIIFLAFNIRHFNNKAKKITILIIIVFGFYALYLAFARVGFLMLIVALISYAVIRKNLKVWLFILAIAFFSIGYLWNLILENPVLYNRLTDFDSFQYGVNYSVIGSGRLSIWSIVIESYLSGNLMDYILGYGYGEALDHLNSYFGTGLAAHNGFLDLLHATGVVGLLIYFLTIGAIYRLLKTTPNSHEKIATSVMFLSYVAMMFVQGGHWIWLYTILSIQFSLMLINKGNLEIIQAKKYTTI